MYWINMAAITYEEFKKSIKNNWEEVIKNGETEFTKAIGYSIATNIDIKYIINEIDNDSEDISLTTLTAYISSLELLRFLTDKKNYENLNDDILLNYHKTLFNLTHVLAINNNNSFNDLGKADELIYGKDIGKNTSLTKTLNKKLLTPLIDLYRIVFDYDFKKNLKRITPKKGNSVLSLTENQKNTLSAILL